MFPREGSREGWTGGQEGRWKGSRPRPPTPTVRVDRPLRRRDGRGLPGLTLSRRTIGPLVRGTEVYSSLSTLDDSDLVVVPSLLLGWSVSRTIKLCNNKNGRVWNRTDPGKGVRIGTVTVSPPQRSPRWIGTRTVLTPLHSPLYNRQGERHSFPLFLSTGFRRF